MLDSVCRLSGKSAIGRVRHISCFRHWGTVFLCWCEEIWQHQCSSLQRKAAIPLSDDTCILYCVTACRHLLFLNDIVWIGVYFLMTVCKICGSSTYKKYSIQYENVHNIHECTACGFHFLDFLDTEDASPVDDPMLSNERLEFIRDKLQSNAERFAWQVAIVDENLGSASTILDVGAGGGKFASILESKGYTVSGIEPNPEFSIFAKQEYGLDFSRQLLEADFWDDKCFDAITMWDVIEHVNDPKELSQRVFDLLPPGGKFFLDTPCRESFFYWGGEMTYKLSFGRFPTLLKKNYSPSPRCHKQIFKTSQIKDMLEEVGFKVDVLEQFHELSFPTRWYLKAMLGSERLAGILAPLADMFIWLLPAKNKMKIVARKP